MRRILKISGEFLITVIFLLIVSAINITAATFTVSTANDSGAGSLRQAINSANAAAGSDAIVFDASFNTAQTITLASQLSIDTVSAADTLTITGPGANLLTVSGNNVTAIFVIGTNSAAIETASISGMTLTNGAGNQGGAIYNSGNLTLTSVILTNNTAAGSGAIYNIGNSLNIIGCTLTNNRTTAANGSGGAIYSIAGTTNISGNTLISGNQTRTNGGAISNAATLNIDGAIIKDNFTLANASNSVGGGGIANGGTATISNTIISGNEVRGAVNFNGNGGGILNQGGAAMTINNSVITGNSAFDYGGGIYYQPNQPTGTFLTITNTTVSNNFANTNNDNFGDGGGLYLVGTGAVTISGSTISGNTVNTGGNPASGNGGGIFAALPTNITNSTVSENTAGADGGGIYIPNGNNAATIVSSTIVNNTAARNGGGVGTNFSTYISRNTIIANNIANGGISADVNGTINSQGYNLIRNTTGATITGITTGNITGVDPRIDGVLRNNGGATKTHALRRTSPALDAAEPGNVPPIDQRGLPRPVDGFGGGGARSDIGAYERQLNDIVVPASFDFDDDGRADLSVFRPVVDPVAADFYVRTSSNNTTLSYTWGLPGDKLVPGDYDNDGKTDVAVYRELSQSRFYIRNSANDSVREDDFGTTGDVLTNGDWDGDGVADPAVYRAGTQSYFYYRGSRNNPSGNITYLPWGTTGDRPLRGDFDGDGKLDAAVLRPSNNSIYIRNSADGSVRYDSWGLSTDVFVNADYDRDGKTDLAVFRNGIWYIKQSANNRIRYETFGLSTDTPVPADYDGDGKSDIAVFRNGIWYIKQSTGAVTTANFGLSGDSPIPAAEVNP